MVTKINFNRQKSQKDARNVRVTGVYKASFHLTYKKKTEAASVFG